MNSKEILTTVLKATNQSRSEIVKKMNWTMQQLNAKIMRDSLRARELLELLDVAGIDVTFTNRETGEVVPVITRIRGAGRRVKGVSNKVTYDTYNADALANNFYADGVNEYLDGKAMELYIDSEGRYFFAEYSCLEGVRDRITAITARDAAAFIDKYGTELHRTPIEN